MRELLALAALNGLLAVVLGAFGAHAVADVQAKAWIATGAQYGLGHAVAALVVADRSRAAAWAMTLGALAFSGALYALALTRVHWLGALAPIGGTLMVAGWALLILNVLRRK